MAGKSKDALSSRKFDADERHRKPHTQAASQIASMEPPAGARKLPTLNASPAEADKLSADLYSDHKNMRGRGYRGIWNDGNSCYVNAALQFLFTVRDFSDR